MAVSDGNRRRYRSILISREWKWILSGVPEKFGNWLARRFVGLLMRWLFLGEDGVPHRAGEVVLAEIRRISGLDTPPSRVFHPDPQVMAYRAGKMAVGRQIFALLHLDEKEVQRMMELDDGLE